MCARLLFMMAAGCPDAQATRAGGGGGDGEADGEAEEAPTPKSTKKRKDDDDEDDDAGSEDGNIRLGTRKPVKGYDDGDDGEDEEDEGDKSEDEVCACVPVCLECPHVLVSTPHRPTTWLRWMTLSRPRLQRFRSGQIALVPLVLRILETASVEWTSQDRWLRISCMVTACTQPQRLGWSS